MINSTILLTGFSSLGNVFELLWLLLLCIAVIAASYYITKFVGGTQIKKQKNSNFKILDVCSLGSNKYLQLVKIGEKYVVISVCKDSVSYITELSEDEIILISESNKNIGFSEILSRFTGKKNNNTNVTDNDESNDFANYDYVTDNNDITDNNDVIDNNDLAENVKIAKNNSLTDNSDLIDNNNTTE